MSGRVGVANLLSTSVLVNEGRSDLEVKRGEPVNDFEFGETGELEHIHRRFAQDLADLARFICGREFAQTVNMLRLESDVLRRAAKLFPRFQGPFLRRELMELIINVLRDEIADLLRCYGSTAQTCPRRHCQPPEQGLGLGGHHLSLVHRLVLLMIYRQGYVAHTCGAMLGCRDDVVDRIHHDGLLYMRGENIDTPENDPDLIPKTSESTSTT
jgi:hypothetical protein